MVIDEKGNQLGQMTPQQAQALASEQGLDVVEVAPNSKPPVCDHGLRRFRYDQRKWTKKQHQTQTKILKSPKTDVHDLETTCAEVFAWWRSSSLCRQDEGTGAQCN